MHNQVTHSFYTGLKLPQRWIIVILGFLSLFNEYAMRICLSITITEMTLPPNNTMSLTDETSCSTSNHRNITHVAIAENSNVDKYNWSEHTQVKSKSTSCMTIQTDYIKHISINYFSGSHTIVLLLGLLIHQFIRRCIKSKIRRKTYSRSKYFIHFDLHSHHSIVHPMG